MLSLRGSIQPDPFSPTHVPTPSIIRTKAMSEEPASDSSTAVVRDYVFPPGEEEEEVGVGSEVDTFEELGRMADEEVRRRAEEVKERERQEEEEQKKEKKEKKRKRKDGEGNEKREKRKRRPES
jgi:DNA-directed RNA polymerase I subunit RPA43